MTELNRLRKIRKKLGLSLEQLSALSKISIATLSEIERGLQIPNQLTIIAISDAINIPAHYIFVLSLRH
jgi:transcriptional regulator with XRE-family HTH domain